jgi:hypothetical protein
LNGCRAASARRKKRRNFAARMADRFCIGAKATQLMRSTSIALQVSASIQVCDFVPAQGDGGTYQVDGAALHFAPARRMHICRRGGSKGNKNSFGDPLS